MIAKSLVGDYPQEHLFTLKQSLAGYRSYQNLIQACDREIRQHLEELQPPAAPATSTDDPEAPKKRQSADGILRTELHRVWGVDLTKIPGVRTGIAQTLFGEIGPDF